jgi:homopolymeric O-antigen transport system ATP-binding protein
MGDISRQGRTVFFVSHNMSAILNLAPKALLLQAGSVLIEGPVESVVSSYVQSLGGGGEIDISSRTDRQGEGQVRFVHAWFEDERGRRINHAISGRRLGIALRYESKTNRPVHNPRVSIAIENLLGNELFVCSTERTKNQPSFLPAGGVIKCVIPVLPLSQGHYHLTLFIESNRIIQDWLKSALTLDVMDGDFFGTGKQYPDGWQGKCVLVHHQWEAHEA